MLKFDKVKAVFDGLATKMVEKKVQNKAFLRTIFQDQNKFLVFLTFQYISALFWKHFKEQRTQCTAFFL